MKAARDDFDREKNQYYRLRYRELEMLRLLPVARAAAEAFKGRERLDGS